MLGNSVQGSDDGGVGQVCTTALQASIKVVNLGNAANERVRAFALIIRTLCEQLIEYDATFGEAKDEQRCAGRCAPREHHPQARLLWW